MAPSLAVFCTRCPNSFIEVDSPFLKLLSHQNPDKNIDMMRDVVLRCLIFYLGEKEDDLIQEYNASDYNYSIYLWCFEKCICTLFLFKKKKIEMQLKQSFFFSIKLYKANVKIFNTK